jgi:hypothetical protein
VIGTMQEAKRYAEEDVKLLLDRLVRRCRHGELATRVQLSKAHSGTRNRPEQSVTLENREKSGLVLLQSAKE